MIQEQDETIREVIQQNGKKLFDFIRNRVREQEDAEDIFQDVLFELTTAYRMMQPIEKMAAWLYRVARNKITDQYRKSALIVWKIRLCLEEMTMTISCFFTT
ncbi:MAG: sigma-70 family RNA polymerase sigma factor [Bacteroidetes bacterium]|nr:sigma-70 family RNA polymerase sigma factor [Bacteroidota bacterium]